MSKSNLTEQQHAGIVLLLAGKSQKDVATKLDVNPSTIFRWTREPEFIAELRRQRLDVHEAAISKLRGLGARAVDTLASALDSEDEGIRLRAASKILDTIGLDKIPEPTDAIDIEDVETEMQQAESDRNRLKLLASIGM